MSSPKARDHATKLTKPTTNGAHGAIKKVIEKRGGHGTWGKPGAQKPVALNKSDPNYDDYDDKDAVISSSPSMNGRGSPIDRRAVRIVLGDLLDEFAESGDVQGALNDLREHSSIDPAEFVAAALVFGVEHRAYERELISQLLSQAHPLLEGKGFDEGFQRVLSMLADLVLDTPNAAEFVGLFVARATFDDALAPVFIKNAVVDSEPAKLALNLAYNVLHEPSERQRLENIWGPSAHTSVAKLRDEVTTIVKEYLEALDVAEADRALIALNAPSFLSQAVKQAVYAAIEGGNHAPRDRVLDLLCSWHTSGIVPEYHVRRGLELAKKGIDEITLDVPHAEAMLTEFLVAAQRRKLPTPL